jgi:hypothetical protein
MQKWYLLKLVQEWGEEGDKGQWWKGVNSSMINLICCKNFCKCHNVPHPAQQLKKKRKLSHHAFEECFLSPVHSPCPPYPHCFLATKWWAASPITCSGCHDVLPYIRSKAIEPADFGLKPLKPWAKTNLSSFKSISLWYFVTAMRRQLTPGPNGLNCIKMCCENLGFFSVLQRKKQILEMDR